MNLRKMPCLLASKLASLLALDSLECGRRLLLWIIVLYIILYICTYCIVHSLEYVLECLKSLAQIPSILLSGNMMCCCNTRSGFWTWFGIIKAALGAGLGVLAAMVFSFGYGNLLKNACKLGLKCEMLAGALTTGTWAVISSVLATVVLHQHLLVRKSKLASFYNTTRFVMKYCFSNIKYCYHYNKLSVHFRLKYFIGGGIICLIGSLSATIYYFSMKVQLSQETYPIKKRYLGCCNSELMYNSGWKHLILKRN